MLAFLCDVGQNRAEAIEVLKVSFVGCVHGSFIAVKIALGLMLRSKLRVVAVTMPKTVTKLAMLP